MTGEITAAVSGLAATASWPDVPEAVRERVRVHVLDTLGLALAGGVSEAAGIVRRWLADDGLTGRGSTVLGTRLRAPARFAAFANAAAAHADNFDDTTPQIDPDRTGGVHASSAVLPAALAVGEAEGSSGAEVLTAYLVGVETASRLNHAVSPRHYAGGFHVTGTLNTFGAAVAAARLAGLDGDAVTRALGIAASRAAGVRRNFGTMAEILHPAHAAEDGIVAAELARRGVTAAADALDGPAGFLAAAGGGARADRIVGRLAAPWVFEHPGVWIKAHPSGALTHPAAACLLDLMRRHRIAAGAVAAIRVRTNRRIVDTLLRGLPENPTEARFSMPFVLAAAALTGRAGLAEFTERMVRDRKVRAMMDRVEHTAFDRGGDGFTNVTALVTVETADGRIVSGRADHARGSTADPLGFDDACARFAELAAHGGHPRGRAAAVPGLVAALDRQRDLSGLCDAMSRGGRKPRV